MSAHRTRLGLPARPGWLVREQVECAPPDGSLHVVAASEPVQDVSTSDFAAGYGQLFAEHLPGYEEIDVRDVQLFGGRPAVLRRYRHVPPDGAPLTQIAAYLVEGGVGHVVTVTTSTSRFAAVEGELLALLAQFDIDRSAVVERPTLTAPTSVRGAHDSASWAKPRKAWEAASQARPREAAGAAMTIGELSADELIALAQLLGGDRFPFLDEADAADALGDGGAAVVRGARRSLTARGLLVPSADGSIVVDEDLVRVVALALDPALVVTVEAEGDEAALVAFALDAEHSVEVTHLGAGAYRLRSAGAATLVDRVAELTGAASAPDTATGSAASVPAIAIDRARAFAHIGDAEGAERELAGHPDLRDALLAAKSFNRVRTVHRAGGAVHGGELVWLHTRDGASWALEPSPADDGAPISVEARPTARGDLYTELLALLP